MTWSLYQLTQVWIQLRKIFQKKVNLRKGLLWEPFIILIDFGHSVWLRAFLNVSVLVFKLGPGLAVCGTARQMAMCSSLEASYHVWYSSNT